jgi:uncharacterized protein YndB with AHSA1/START domain
MDGAMSPDPQPGGTNEPDPAFVDVPEQTCRDEAVIPAPIDEVWAVLSDLTTYPRWWTLIQVVPLSEETRVLPGTPFRIEGSRPGGPTRGWNCEVLEVDAPRRIEIAYVSGDLLGRSAWELEPVDGGTKIAYVYRGVRPNEEGSALTFRRYGTRLHNVAMQADALSGIARYIKGEPLGDEWRSDVEARMTAGVQALD